VIATPRAAAPNVGLDAVLDGSLGHKAGAAAAKIAAKHLVSYVRRSRIRQQRPIQVDAYGAPRVNATQPFATS
jgi:hypothetical protein